MGDVAFDMIKKMKDKEAEITSRKSITVTYERIIKAIVRIQRRFRERRRAAMFPANRRV